MPTVYEYDTGRTLGTPSEELTRKSEEAHPTGAVLATLGDDGVWQYVPDCQRDLYERVRHVEVFTVYID